MVGGAISVARFPERLSQTEAQELRRSNGDVPPRKRQGARTLPQDLRSKPDRGVTKYRIMTPDLLQCLRARGAAIRHRWETLLRIEPVSSPLANPDALVHLIPASLDQIFQMLAVRRSHAVPSLATVRAYRLPPCDCGNNPYLAYFVAGEQALVETIVLLQSEMQLRQSKESDVAEIVRVVRQLTRDEIDAFCGICNHRGAASQCRHDTAAV